MPCKKMQAKVISLLTEASGRLRTGGNTLHVRWHIAALCMMIVHPLIMYTVLFSILVLAPKL